MTDPRVSVIIPVRNGDRTLARAIDSALAQNYGDGMEVIVINDGSTDDTRAVMDGYEGRIVALHRPWSGLPASRNAGIFAASGKYIALLDADDYWPPQKIARSVAALETDSGLTLAYTDGFEIDLAGNITSETYFREGLKSPPTLDELLNFSASNILPSTVVMRRSLLQDIGGFDEQLLAFEDFECWLRARELGPFCVIQEPLAFREVGPSSARERWYVDGAPIVESVVRKRYGKRMTGAPVWAVLLWSGREALKRGDAELARKRYFEALCRKPSRPKTCVALAMASIPAPLRLAIARMLPGRYRERFRPYTSDETSNERRGKTMAAHI